MKRKIELLAALAVVVSTTTPVLAQGNFFGSGGATPPGAVGNVDGDETGNSSSSSNSMKSSNSSNSPGMASGPTGGDYTSDEKRMQRKYKDNVKHAKDLIAKGESMMKSCNGNVNHKDYKKGKIYKEIGEKSLADLTANNPFPELEKQPVKAGKSKDSNKQEL